MTSQDPVTSKSHISKITMEMCGRVRGPFPVSWHFPDCSPAFPCLTVSFFLLRLRGFSFLFLSHFSFCLCSCTGISVGVGFSISQPAFPSCQYVIPSEKHTSMTSVDCRVISSSHVQFNEMKVRLGHSYVRIQASNGCKSAFEVAPLLEGSKPTAHRSRDVGMSSCTNENNKNKLTSRTEEIRRQNIRLNSCSFTLKERPDSDDMVRQKVRRNTKVTCWWCRDADVLQSSRSRIRSARGHVRRHATVLHDNNTEG